MHRAMSNASVHVIVTTAVACYLSQMFDKLWLISIDQWPSICRHGLKWHHGFGWDLVQIHLQY